MRRERGPTGKYCLKWLLIIAISASLLALAITDLMRLVQKLNNSTRVIIEYKSGGDKQPALVALSALEYTSKDLKRADSFSINNLCDCHISSVAGNEACRKLALTQTGMAQYFTITTFNFNSQLFHMMLFDLQLEYEKKQSLVINCTVLTKEEIGIFFGLVGEDMNKFINMAATSEPDVLLTYFVETLEGLQYSALRNGYRTRVLMTRMVYQGVDEQINDVNTRFDLHLSRTRHLDKFNSEFLFAWSSDKWFHEKQISLNAWLDIGTTLVAFLLASERVLALYTRLMSKKP